MKCLRFKTLISVWLFMTQDSCYDVTIERNVFSNNLEGVHLGALMKEREHLVSRFTQFGHWTAWRYSFFIVLLKTIKSALVTRPRRFRLPFQAILQFHYEYINFNLFFIISSTFHERQEIELYFLFTYWKFTFKSYSNTLQDLRAIGWSNFDL